MMWMRHNKYKLCNPAGLNPIKDALIIEDGNSPYANILAIRQEDESREDLKSWLMH